jgi:hypothetical protein
MNDIYTLTLIYLLLELFETQWQKAGTLVGMLENMYAKFRGNVLLFLLLHPTFYFTIYLAMITDYSAEILLVLFIKTFDIATKIILMVQVFEKQEVSQELGQVLLAPLNKLMPYIGVGMYVPLVFMGLIH